MKYKKIILFLLLFVGVTNSYSQENNKKNIKDTTTLNLKEAIEIAITKSNEAQLSDTKVATKKLEVQSVKNNQYPDMKISGQYMRLTNASVDLKINSSYENISDSIRVGRIFLRVCTRRAAKFCC